MMTGEPFTSTLSLGSSQLLKCIAFCNPNTSKAKISKILEFIETQKHNKEQNIYIYTPIEHIRFAKECKDIFSYVVDSSSSSTSPKRIRPTSEIIIDSTDYTITENFKSFIMSFPQFHSPFQIVVIVSTFVQRAESVLFPYLFTTYNADFCKGETSSTVSVKKQQYRHRNHHHHHGASTAKINLFGECLVFCCFCHHQHNQPSTTTSPSIRLSCLSIRDEISHSQKFHESPLFPFPFKIQNLDPPSPY